MRRWTVLIIVLVALGAVVRHSGGQQSLTLETADTAEARARGLSGRDDLPADSGMKFAFDEFGEQCMWMKDMRFNLDIVWTDENNKITKIVEDVSPDSYPKTFCGDAKYVYEYKAGKVARSGMKVGEYHKP